MIDEIAVERAVNGYLTPLNAAECEIAVRALLARNMSPATIAVRLGLHEDRVRQWIQRGVFHAFTPAGYRYERGAA